MSHAAQASRSERSATAKESGQTVRLAKPYAPTPLAPNDPFALVCSLLLVPLLVGGYMAATLLNNALGPDSWVRGGPASGRWHGMWLLGFAVATGLVVDLIVTYLLDGLPSDSFWIVWPIAKPSVTTRIAPDRVANRVGSMR